MSVRYESRWGEAKVILERNIEAGVKKATTELTAEIMGQVEQKGLIDTGNYFRSWTFDIDPDGMGATVGSPVEYGPYLEYGTRFRAARPHVVPAARYISRRIAEWFKRLER